MRLYAKEESEWEKHGNVWTKEYDDVLVRNIGYSETDQRSGYDLFFADETVPEGYSKTVESWERSDKQDNTDYLTTTITFRNEYLYEPLTLTATKEWAGNDEIVTKHPAVTFYLMRSVNGDPFEKVEGSEKDIDKDATGNALTVSWVNYNKLWKLLIDKGMMKKDLREASGITTNALAKLGKNERVTTDVLDKICCTYPNGKHFDSLNNRAKSGSILKMGLFYPYVGIRQLTDV